MSSTVSPDELKAISGRLGIGWTKVVLPLLKGMQ